MDSENKHNKEVITVIELSPSDDDVNNSNKMCSEGDTDLKKKESHPEAAFKYVCHLKFATLEALNEHQLAYRKKKLPKKPKPLRKKAQKYRKTSLILTKRRKALAGRKKKYNKAPNQFVVPVVDLKEKGVKRRLNTLQIRDYITLRQILKHEQFFLPTYRFINMPQSSNTSGEEEIISHPLGPLMNLKFP